MSVSHTYIRKDLDTLMAVPMMFGSLNRTRVTFVSFVQSITRTWLANHEIKLHQTTVPLCHFTTKCVKPRSQTVGFNSGHHNLRRHSDFDFSELKRRLKAEQKAKEKAEKQAAATVVTKEQAQFLETEDLNKEEDISPNVSPFCFL